MTSLRECVRAVILTPDSEILLLHLVPPARDLWITPGGGIAPGESHHEALLRELKEELGCDHLLIGPQIWVRHGTYEWQGETRSEREYFYLVHAERFVADSSGNPVPGEKEILEEIRWWPIADLPPYSTKFAPARLGELVAELIQKGAPAEPIETGF